MDRKTIFVRTSDGESEIGRRTNQLSGDIKRTLLLVDGKSTVDELLKHAAPSLRPTVGSMLKQLLDGGYIEDKAAVKAGRAPKMAVPKMSVPGKKQEDEGMEELDFTTIMRAPTPEVLAAEAEKAKAREQAEAQAKQQAEAEAARNKAEQEKARARAEQEAARAKAEAEAQAKAKQEAEAARLKAEQAAAKARAEAEAARIKAEQEAEQARAEAARAKAQADAEAKALAEAQAKAQQEIAAAQLKAKQEAEKARAEAEAARIKAEQEAEKARAEAEAARIKAEQEAAKAKAEAEAIRRKAEQEAERRAKEEAERRAKEEAERKAKEEAERKAKEEAERKAKEEAERRAKEEAERKAKEEAERKAKEEAERRAKEEAERRAKEEAERKAREEAERKAREEAERKAREEAERQARQQAEAHAEFDVTKLKTGQGAARSTIATVLFFDVVGYTKLPGDRQIELKGQFNHLVSEFIKEFDETQRIILDTGDGAAIGFLQHPEDALDVAMRFRDAVTANRHHDYPELNVRAGIHLGAINVVKDMNGQFNMVGDGINDAQRVMSFADADQIFVSRSYFDVVSRLTAGYADLFKYRGVKQDKHGREHQVYEVMDGHGEAAGQAETMSGTAAQPEISLGPIVLEGLEETAETAPAEAAAAAEAVPEIAEVIEEVPARSSEEIAAEEAAAAQRKAQEEEVERRMAEARAREEAEHRAREEEEARKLADEQAKAWAEAEQRAKAQAEAQTKIEEADQRARQTATAAPKVARAPRKPLPWGKIGGGLFVLSLALVALLPYVWPMQGYIPQIEKRLSAQFKQPVHIGQMSATLLPSPKLELHNISVGRGKELQAGSMVLHFDFSDLLADTRVIDDAELNNLQLQGASFDKTLSWLQAVGGVAHYPLLHMTLHGARVDTEAIKLPVIGGKVDFDRQGHFSGAVLNSEDGKVNVQLLAQQGKLTVEMNLKGSELPALPYLHFNELNAQGQLTDGGIDFREVDAQLYGGTLVGNAQLSWQKGWLMQGRVIAKGIDVHAAFPKAGVEGELHGKGSYSMHAERLVQFGGNPMLDSDFSLQKGMFSDMDMVEVVRLSRRDGAPGGRTHFDELNGKLVLENGIQRYRHLTLAAGVLSASGYLDIDTAGVLNGHLLAELKVRPGSVPLLLTGKLGEPVLRAAR